jgi:hypothetical protein
MLRAPPLPPAPGRTPDGVSVAPIPPAPPAANIARIWLAANMICVSPPVAPGRPAKPPEESKNPVERFSRRCEIIRRRRRNFNLQFASIPTSTRHITSTGALAWRKENTKRRSKRSGPQPARGGRTIRRLASWERLAQDSDIRQRLLPPTRDPSSLPNSNWLLAPVTHVPCISERSPWRGWATEKQR